MTPTTARGRTQVPQLTDDKDQDNRTRVASAGDGDSDHLCWERAEDMSTPRTAFKIDINNPGSEVAGETAAALAAAAKAFKPYDRMYSDLLLLHSKQVQRHMWL
jgi:hypothetical protein